MAEELRPLREPAALPSALNSAGSKVAKPTAEFSDLNDDIGAFHGLRPNSPCHCTDPMVKNNFFSQWNLSHEFNSCISNCGRIY